ncbi:MAG: nucleotidyltransferase family protein, partial [Chloroflexota bacterium]
MAGQAQNKVTINPERIARFCQIHHIRKLSLFGSVLGSDFRRSSDVDVLVEFEPNVPIGFIRLAGLESELGEILGRRVDLRTP